MNTSTSTALYSPSVLFNTQNSGKEISVQTVGQSILLKPEEITCLQGDGNYTYIHTNRGKKHLVSRTLKSLSDHLDSGFIRVHKSYIINASYVVDRLEEGRIIRMACGTEVCVARRKVKEIASLLDRIEKRISA